ncbi:unnamed protein product [Camellia sinensis]
MGNKVMTLDMLTGKRPIENMFNDNLRPTENMLLKTKPPNYMFSPNSTSP